MEQVKLVRKTLRLEPEIAKAVDSKPKPTEYMRSAISNAIARESNPKTNVDIHVDLTNTNTLVCHSHDFHVSTTLSNDFKASVLPFFEAVEMLQREIDRMNKEETEK